MHGQIHGPSLNIEKKKRTADGEEGRRGGGVRKDLRSFKGFQVIIEQGVYLGGKKKKKTVFNPLSCNANNNVATTPSSCWLSLMKGCPS